MQSAGVWMFNPWARALTGTPHNTQMDHGEEQIASYFIVLKSSNNQQCITLTEVWMEAACKETKLLILQGDKNILLLSTGSIM